MSVACYVVLERKIPGFEIFINGKALGHASELLDSLAKDEGVLPLSDFFSVMFADRAVRSKESKSFRARVSKPLGDPAGGAKPWAKRWQRH